MGSWAHAWTPTPKHSSSSESTKQGHVPTSRGTPERAALTYPEVGPRRPACPTATIISTIEQARTRSVHLPARGPGRPTLGAAPAGWASGGGVGAPSCTPGRGADGRAAGARVGPRSLPSGPSSRCPRPAQVRLRHAGRPSRAWRGGIRGGAERHRAVWLAVTALLSSHLSAHAAAGTPAPAADYRRLSSSARPPATGIGPAAGWEHRDPEP